MSLIGVSTLELRQLIEQAFLPENCEVSCPDGESLTIRLGRKHDLIVYKVCLDSLTTCHDVHNLVEELHRQQRLNRTLGHPRSSPIV